MANDEGYGEGFGTVSIEREFSGARHWKLREPDKQKGEEVMELIVGLLPAMHSYKETRKWCFYHAKHYGNVGNNPYQPDKPKARAHGCIQRKKKDKTIEVHCPKCDQIAVREAQLAKVQREILNANPDLDEKTLKKSDAYQNDKRVKLLNDWLKKHNRDSKYYMNCMVQTGTRIEFGDLALSYKFVEEKLRPYLNELLEKKKIDVFHPTKGVWLRFTRRGRNPNVTDSVEMVTDSVQNGDEILEKPRRRIMTPDQIQTALKTCIDLDKDVVEMISAETMTELINCNGDPDEVDRIWPPKKTIEKVKQQAAQGNDESKLDDLLGDGGAGKAGPDETKAAEGIKTVVKAKPVEDETDKLLADAAAETPAEEEDDGMAAALAAVEAIKAKAAAKKAGKTATPAKKAPAPKEEASSAEDFAAEFEQP